MIDFYYSLTSELDEPIEENFVMSLSKSDFININELIDFARSNEIPFFAHSDFFIPLDALEKITDFISELEFNDKSLESYNKITDVINSAISLKCGLYAFCD